MSAEQNITNGFCFGLLHQRQKHKVILRPVPNVAESIQQSIFTILSTTEGERPLDPTFGCVLQSFVYSRLDESILNSLAYEVRKSLERCEPRMAVKEVTVVRDVAEPTHLKIHILYVVQQTGVMYSTVYPMSLFE